MDCFEELAKVLNEAGVELSSLKSSKTDLIKKLFLWATLMKNCSESNETSIRPYANYLSTLYMKKSAKADK